MNAYAKFTQGLLDNKRILDALAIHPGQLILDAGCGTGYMAKLFAAKTGLSGKVWAMDKDTGISALTLKALLGLGSYNTAWTWLHKFRRCTIRDEWENW
ncbi:MAG: hypothetical protein R2874_02815 [Desulfobacterales bacterium]